MGRFTSADTIIPSHQGVQGWDRFAYTNNNPLRYTDPSGHGVDCGLGESCVTDPYTSPLSGNGTESANGESFDNVDNIVDASPQLAELPTNSATSPSDTNLTGCVYVGTSDGYCSDFYIYVLSSEENIDDFFAFLLALDNYSLSDAGSDIAIEGGVRVTEKLLEKWGAELLGDFAGPASFGIDLVQDYETGNIDIFADHAVEVIHHGNSDVLVTSQTYINNGNETGPYIQVASGPASSPQYNGSYVNQILQYLGYSGQ